MNERQEGRERGEKTGSCPLCVFTFALRIKTETLTSQIAPRSLSLRRTGVYDDICTVMCVHNHLTLNDAWTSLLSSWFVSRWKLQNTRMSSHIWQYGFNPPLPVFIDFGKHVTNVRVLGAPAFINLTHSHT